MKKVKILELSIMPDHVYMVVIIPPKLAIAEFMGIIKGKTAVVVFQQNKSLNHFWSRGCYASTTGIDEEKIQKYIKYQENTERLNEDHEE